MEVIGNHREMGTPPTSSEPGHLTSGNGATKTVADSGSVLEPLDVVGDGGFVLRGGMCDRL